MAPQTSKITVVSPSGERASIYPSALSTALSGGWRTLSPEEQTTDANKEKYSGSPIKAALAGAARTASFGLTGFVKPEEQRLLAQYNPEASTAGEIGGAFIPGPGVPAAIGKLGGFVAKNVAGGALKKLLAKGAAEGAIYGAGQAIGDIGLQNEGLTSENLLAGGGKVLSSAFLGAAIPGAASAVGYGVNKGLGLAGRALGKEAPNLKLKAMGFGSKEFEKHKGIKDDLVKVIDEEGFLEGAKTPRAIASHVNEVSERSGAALGAAREKVYQAIEAGEVAPPKIGKWLSSINKEVINPLRKKNLPEFRDSADKVLERFKIMKDKYVQSRKVIQEPAPKSAAEAFYGEGQLSDYTPPKGKSYPAGPKVTLKEVIGFREDLDDILKFGQADTSASVVSAMKPLRKARNQTEAFIHSFMEDALKKISPEDVAQYAKNKKIYQASQIFKKTTASNEAKEAASGIFGRSVEGATIPTLGGLTLGGPLGGLAGAAAGAVLNKPILARAPAAMAYVASRGGKLASSSEKTMGKVNKFIDDLLQPTTAKVATPVLSAAIKDKGELKHVAQSISAAASNPQRVTELAEQLTASMGEMPPGVAIQLASKFSTAMNFLAEKAPKKYLSDASLNPLQKPYEPSDSELSKFNRYYQAVLNPLKVVESVSKGDITTEGAEALKVVYPSLYEYIIKQISMRAAEKGKELPYKRRVALSTLFGTPLDDSMKKDSMRIIQSSYAQNAQAQKQQQNQAVSGASKNISIANTSLTPSQRTQKRGL